ARRFTALAAAEGVAPAALAIAWCLRNPHVSTVILGASRVAQLVENFDALQLATREDPAWWAQVEGAVA
ncbi:aldo/keto reductase, partial [Xanthomonas translucens]